MSLDSYVTLGRSGLRVSPFALGAMTFGEDHGFGADAQQSVAMMDEYLGLGGNIIDTANMYTNGHSEKIIGDYFARETSRRDRVVLSTKFFGNLHRGDPNGGGGGRKAMIEQCENSLRRLQTDYIDLYWLHNWDRGMPIEETLRAMDDLVTSGKVRYLGVSDLPAWKIAEAHTLMHFRGWSPFIAVQLEYSLLERTVEGELTPMALEMGLGVMPWSPLKRGWLSGKYTRANANALTSAHASLIGAPAERDYAIIDVLLEIAAQQNATPSAVALAWVQSRPGVVSTLIGARSVLQLRDNLMGLEVKLTDEHINALNAASVPTLNFPAKYASLASDLAFAGANVDGVQTTSLFLREGVVVH